MLAPLLAVFLFSSPTAGFEKPLNQQRVPMAPSSTSAGVVELRCTTYPTFVVLEVVDPGLKGAQQSVRRTTGTAIEPCAKQPGDRALADAEGYFWGAVGGLVLIEGADQFGNQRAFRVFDAASGEPLFRGVRNVGERFVVSRGKGAAPGLAYHHGFEASCSLIDAGKDECWTKALRAEGVPASLAITRPDCERAFREGKSPKNNRALVSLEVRVADLRSPKLQFVLGAATCAPAP